MIVSPYQILVTLLFAILLTLASTFLEIHWLSKSKPKNVVNNFNYWLYFSIQLVGNVIATGIAAQLLKDKLNDELSMLSFALYPFLGVFGFWAVLSRSNINLLSAKVLTFDEWIEKVKEMASETAKKNEANAQTKEKVDLVIQLMLCEEKDIDFNLKEKLTTAQKTQLLKELKDNSGDEKRVKCRRLVSIDIELARILAQNKKKELATTKKSIFDLIKK